ncbi:MAG: hypothetical protein J7M34_08115 [Anaerolineae bacterium]|nr:hypothetical protein [Anaerolineae bacterium]
MKLSVHHSRFWPLGIGLAILLVATMPIVTALQCPSIIVYRVYVTDVRDTSFTVTWITDIASDGHVDWGLSTSLGNTKSDPVANTTTHYVTVGGLSPNTTYYFRVRSGAAVDDNEGTYYSVTTGPTLDIPVPGKIVWGYVYDSDGMTPVANAIVYLQLQDMDGRGSLENSQWVATRTDDSGAWFYSLVNVRTANGYGYFEFTDGVDRLRIVAQGGDKGCIGEDGAERTVPIPVSYPARFDTSLDGVPNGSPISTPNDTSTVTPTATPTSTPSATPTPSPTSTATPTHTATSIPGTRTMVSYQALSPPMINGDISEWPITGTISLDPSTAHFIAPRSTPDPLDSSATIRSAWDDEHLYFAIHVVDDVLVADSAEMWKDDAIEMGIDGLHDHLPYGPDDHQFTFVVDGRVGEFGVPISGMTFYTREVSSGFDMEIAIPRSLLNLETLDAGHVLGFTWALRDDDGNRQGDWESHMVWEGTQTVRSSADWGQLRLDADPILWQSTSTPTLTVTPTPTATPTPSTTFTPTVTPTSTPTATFTSTVTPTSTPAPTEEPMLGVYLPVILIE